MNNFDEEIVKLWKVLNQNDVKYIVVGGFAVNLYATIRLTADLDLWIKDTPENRKNLRRSLFQASMGDFEAIESSQFVPGWTTLPMSAGFELDIMTFIKGFPAERFDECYSKATIADLFGVPVRFLNINQLIESKKATARLQDKMDVEALEKIANAC